MKIPTIITTNALSLVALLHTFPDTPTTNEPSIEVKAGILLKARAEKKLVAKPAQPIRSMARVSRRKRGWPFLSAMQRRKPGTVRKSARTGETCQLGSELDKGRSDAQNH